MKLNLSLVIVAILSATILSGCGGGGDDGKSSGSSKLVCANFQYQESAQDALKGGASQLDADHDGIACESLPHRPSANTSTNTPVVVPTYPLQSAYKALVSTSRSNKFSVSGTCSGSATISTSAPSATTFEGSAALSATTTSTVTFVNCTPALIATAAVDYYDSNYNPLGGLTVTGGDYSKFIPVPNPLPISVKVGDSAVFGTEINYSSVSKTTVTGQSVLSYIIEPDGASTSTAIVNLTTKNFNSSSQLLSTQQARYRITTAGRMTVVSTDLQASTTGSNHLLFVVN